MSENLPLSITEQSRQYTLSSYTGWPKKKLASITKHHQIVLKPTIKARFVSPISTTK